MCVKLRKYNHFSSNPAVLAVALQVVPEDLPNGFRADCPSHCFLYLLT
jgi:hypothetical protein